jgi:hypothetical protein
MQHQFSTGGSRAANGDDFARRTSCWSNPYERTSLSRSGTCWYLRMKVLPHSASCFLPSVFKVEDDIAGAVVNARGA